MATKTTLGFIVERFDRYANSTQYSHASVEVYKIETQSWSNYEYKSRVVQFTWQTDKKGNDWRDWYGFEVKPDGDQFHDVETINYFANLMRKIVRKTDLESIRNAQPAHVIKALESMKARQMVYDKRTGARVYVDSINEDEDVYALMGSGHQSDWVLKYFYAKDERSAQDRALAFLAKEAEGKGPDSDAARNLATWVGNGMPLNKRAADAPDTKTGIEIVTRQDTFVNYNSVEVDPFGEPLES